MCGIAGYLSPSLPKNLSENATKMINQLHFRGPDDKGVWVDETAGLALAHSRLSIIDLSPAGHQPMQSHNQRYVIVFNGEIYNHIAIRDELEKVRSISWLGHSDTETLIEGFSTWGIKETLVKTTGMFAFAVWDNETHSLTLGRDRLGEKPLFYGWQGNNFYFGSELKAIKANPEFNAEIDRNSLALYLRHNYVPEPYSIYKDITKLKPGCTVTFQKNDRTGEIKPYWSAIETAKKQKSTPFEGSPTEAVDELEKRLSQAVKQQMVADVPLGAFLSGGIDSSSIVSLMQAQSSNPVNTFTIGFDVADYNEAEHAKAVAKHLGTNHTEEYITSEKARQVIPELPEIYDEPFADESQIPTFLVSKIAKKHVTVSLSGDAGDELFCGYNRYHITDKLWGKLSPVPQGVRKVMASGLTSVSPSSWNNISKIILKKSRPQLLGEKIHKGAGVLSAASIQELYKGITSTWKNPESLVLDSEEPPTQLTENFPDIGELNPIEQMMLLDLLTYLPDDILAKVDRAAMRNSLETRVPMLDHDIIEFAWSLPVDLKLHKGISKWPLREMLYRYVPKDLIERPKMGFSVPISQWLRGPLREWAETLLDENRLREEGFFDVESVKSIWHEHLSDQFDRSQQLWTLLMFQAWYEKQ